MGCGRSWPTRYRLRALAGLGLLLLLGSAAVLAVPYRHSLATVRAYEAGSGTRVIPAEVRDLEKHPPTRSSNYWVEVQGPASVSGRIELDGSDPVLSRLRKGDRIGVVVWHRQRTGITFHGRVQETIQAPNKIPGLLLCAGVCLLHIGVLALHMAARSRRAMREPPSPGPDQPFPLAARVIAGSVALTVLTGIVAAESHESSPVFYVEVWLPLALITLAVWGVRCWIHSRW
jgi:hypothetical protein